VRKLTKTELDQLSIWNAGIAFRLADSALEDLSEFIARQCIHVKRRQETAIGKSVACRRTKIASAFDDAANE